MPDLMSAPGDWLDREEDRRRGLAQPGTPGAELRAYTAPWYQRLPVAAPAAGVIAAAQGGILGGRDR